MLVGLATWFKANKSIGIVALALLAIVAVGTVVHLIDAGNEQARDAGAQTERAATTGKVIENVEKAKAAADDVRRSGPTRDECLQDSRVRQNC